MDTGIDIYRSYLEMRIHWLEVKKLSPSELRHHKRKANFQLEAYKDALGKYEEVRKHGSLQV